MGLFVMLLVAACARVPQQASKEAFQEAQCQYDSGFQLFENKALMEAFPYFIQVAGKLEVLPEDMNSEEKLLTSQAYYRMGLVFKSKMETNAEIETLKRALYYQQMVNDSSLVLRSSLTLARAYSVIRESDSARYYLNRVAPLIDTVSGDLVDYYSAQMLLSDLYYDQHKFDSCFFVQQELIAFKTRRDIDTKNDSVSLGIAMFHSPYILQSKPYLLKVLDADFGDMERGAIMSLLARIYEAEGNADSVAFCQTFHATYVQAESDRVSDGMLAVKQYERFKTERDARLQALREEKDARNAQKTRCIWIVVVVLVAFAAVWLFFSRRRRHLNALKDKDHEALQIKVQAIFSDRMNNKMERIRNEFNASYPDALEKLQAAYPELSDTELDICLLSFFSFRLKEAADLLNLRENTVAKYRTAIKKKTQTDDLEGFLKPFLG
jgi:DNA-binding CsgD family transcriptional regulator